MANAEGKDRSSVKVMQNKTADGIEAQLDSLLDMVRKN